MALVATEDIIKFHRVRETKDGYWAERAIDVTGFTRGAPKTALVLGATINDANGNPVSIPAWAAEHPWLIGTLCTEVEQVPQIINSQTALRVIATYGPAELVNAWKITISGSNGVKELSTDKNGNPYFTIHYNGSSGSNLIDFGTAQYLAPGSIVTFEHDEYESPLSKIKSFKSCTNSASFLGYDVHKVLCRDIEAESFVSGTRWHVRYIFEICPDPLGWQQVFLWHDLYTGRVPSDVSGTDGTNGVLVADPYQKLGLTADFNALSLPTGLL